MKELIKCRWCGGSDGDEYIRESEYSFVESCNKSECMEKTDERIEEIMEAEESGED
jgi:hypothetical protein